MAVTGTLKLKDEGIRECQKNTLITLLKNTSSIGQVPGYVNIETRKPEFSGVGGICSIDSNLWLIIACYDYIQEYRDIPLLKAQIGKLYSIMSWLRCLDSNNDNLLEIPEAGDWTDLFGRSYHVLYDEVLWYRANLCFGLLLESLHRYQEAALYLEHAESIRTVILEKFWPSTNMLRREQFTFADTQYSIGDARYLIAEITPFNFNWRCDVFGNLLASLFNVLDAERSKKVLRFLWGVGVNDPFPVTNIYPSVESGSPDWKQYYVVNSLNLPHHYHNGGIWPFIGGFWVRFLHHLGLRSIATRELLKVARINRRGIFREWEFNEWAHGCTGRPMGKAYQTWSASEYLHAFHDLHLDLLQER